MRHAFLVRRRRRALKNDAERFARSAQRFADSAGEGRYYRDEADAVMRHMLVLIHACVQEQTIQETEEQ